MCPHEPKGKCGHINQIMTARVTCMTGPMKLYEICAYIFNFVKSHDIILCNTSSTPKSHFPLCLPLYVKMNILKYLHFS